MKNVTVTVSWPFGHELIQSTLEELIPRLKESDFGYDAFICSNFLKWEIQKKHLHHVEEIVKDYHILKLIWEEKIQS